MEKSSMIKEYFDFYTEKILEYGERTCVLYENGAFYEVYQIDEELEKIGNASKLSPILNNMTYTSKVIGKITVHFIGFNTSCLDKFLPLLLNENYTVVIVSQLETSDNRVTKGNLKRGVTKTYSPSLQPIDYNSGSLIFLMVNVCSSMSSSKKNAKVNFTVNTSVCAVNNEYNSIELCENIFQCSLNDLNSLNQCLDEVDRIIYRYFPKEVQVRIQCDSQFWGKNLFSEFFSNNYENVTVRQIDLKTLITHVDEQNSFLKDIYSHVNFGMLQPIEYMELQDSTLSVINLIVTLQFIGRHDVSYTRNLNIPKVVVENKYLVLELNTVSQLNIVNGTTKNNLLSVFDVINHTHTAIGKRHLQSLLCKPFKSSEVIQSRYNITEQLRGVLIDQQLSEICDFEKLHRKMCILQLHPFEFVRLDSTYTTVTKMIDNLQDNCKLENILPSAHLMNRFKHYVEDYKSKLDLDSMKSIMLNSGKEDIINYFKVGVVPELDVIQHKINCLEEKRETLRTKLESYITTTSTTLKTGGNDMIKLVYTDSDGYAFSCTKLRYELLVKNCSELKHTRVKASTSAFKFYPDELIKLSTELLNLKDLLHKKIRLHYIDMLRTYYTEYSDIFVTMKTLVEILDVCNSNLKCSERYNYAQPTIANGDSSFIEATQLRHPIIERLGTNYVPNNISLTQTANGMLLYGLNSSGKSSLLRAVGISVILAQCGLYVPSERYIFNPFDTVICQVDLTDNLFSGKSSYIMEMMGLKKILRCCGKNTLVLCDEMSKGTESYSSVSLVASTIKKLLDNNTKFFFTSHLHDIAKLGILSEYISKRMTLQVNHLDITIKDDNHIIFNRMLKTGSGSELYGLEVAKSLLDDNQLIDCAFAIRNELVGNKDILSRKKSVYNRKKIIRKCEICGSTKSLETDHIKEQKDTDEKGFVLNESYHKNEVFNLAILCKSCHLKKTQGQIVIEGYKDTSKGRVLIYYET